MDIWYKIRKYLILWAIIFICLVLYTIVKYREYLWSYIVGNVTTAFSGIVTIVLMIAIIVWLIRAIFS